MATKHIQSELKFLECETCVNLDLDPWVCRYCKNASNYDGGGDESEELEYHDFQAMVVRGDFE